MDQVKLMGNIMNKAWGIDQIFCNLTPLRLEKCAYVVPIFSLILASGLDAWDLSNPNMFTWWLGGSRIVYLNLSIVQATADFFVWGCFKLTTHDRKGEKKDTHTRYGWYHWVAQNGIVVVLKWPKHLTILVALSIYFVIITIGHFEGTV